MDYSQLIAGNQARWEKCSITPSRLGAVKEVAQRLCSALAKPHYIEAQNATGVPWWVIAMIHEREATQDWKANIAQGDPWNQVSRHVPRGRGPFKSWLEAAVDALVNCAPFAARWKDWSAGGALMLLDLYNGLGYELYHHEASPYLWAATNEEERGKYLADGKFDASVWDTQIGCSAMLKAMGAIDASILEEKK